MDARESAKERALAARASYERAIQDRVLLAVVAKLREAQQYASPYQNPSGEDLAWKRAMGNAITIVRDLSKEGPA